MKKSLYVLLAILIIFVVIYMLLVHQEKNIFAPGKTENFLGLDSAAVDRIEFRKFDTKLIFKKENQKWYIIAPDLLKADDKAVQRMLALASHLEVGEIISSNPENQLWFQVDNTTCTRLDFFSGQDLLTSLCVGKMSDDRMNGYIRKIDSDDVYLVGVEFVNITQQGLDRWRSRTIFAFDPEQVKEIEWSYDTKKFKLAKKDTLWQLGEYPYQEMRMADVQAVQNHIQTLAFMKADDISLDSRLKETDSEKNNPLLTITLQDGYQEKLFVIESLSDENQYFVRTDKDENVYTLYKYNFKQLTKDITDFLPQEKP